MVAGEKSRENAPGEISYSPLLLLIHFSSLFVE